MTRRKVAGTMLDQHRLFSAAAVGREWAAVGEAAGLELAPQARGPAGDALARAVVAGPCNLDWATGQAAIEHHFDEISDHCPLIATVTVP